eukprot:CCRYP_006744-RA/>CCRYP_006744-RA protein AED:0.21 eAED:0.11 QI:0/0/0/1/0/0/2/0/93
MKLIKVLCAIDDDGDPREPVYKIGPVIKLGKNVNNHSRNHVDYVDNNGGYDITLVNYVHIYLLKLTMSRYSAKQVSCLIQEELNQTYAHTNHW